MATHIMPYPTLPSRAWLWSTAYPLERMRLGLGTL
jgi:hypothetical protein